jgi:hypothetical protein
MSEIPLAAAFPQLRSAHLIRACVSTDTYETSSFEFPKIYSIKGKLIMIIDRVGNNPEIPQSFFGKQKEYIGNGKFKNFV